MIFKYQVRAFFLILTGFFLIIWFAFLTVEVCGQQQSGTRQSQLQYEVVVALKLVQVYVMDKDGRPASDLTIEDFEVFDNDKPVKITHFEKHFPETEIGHKDQTQPGINRKFFLVFDFAFTDARGILRAKNAGLQFMTTSLLSGDEVGLLSYSANRGFVVHEYLTTDHDRIRNIISSFGLKSAAGRAENLSSFYYDDILTDLQDTTSSRQQSSEELFFSNQARLQTGRLVDTVRRQGYVDQAKFYLQSLLNLAKVLRVIPGYKNIILFSGGIARNILFGRVGGAVVGEWSTIDQLAQQLSDYDASLADTGLRQDFSMLLKEMKSANSPVYAIDISRALKGTDVESFEKIDPGMREFEGVDSLRQLASETGGRFYSSTVSLDNAMEEIEDLTKSYYILGFSVPEKWDGKFHRIKVRVKKKGYRVHSQAGYFNPKLFKDFTSFDKLLHLIDLALADNPQFGVPIEIPVRTLTIFEKGWPKIVSFACLSGQEMSDLISKKAEAYLLLFDQKGDLVWIKKFKIIIPEKDRKKELFIPSIESMVKPGIYNSVFVLRSLDTGKGARGQSSIKIEPVQPGPPYMETPLLLALDTRAAELTAGGELPLSSIYGYPADYYVPVSDEIPSGQNRIFAALRLWLQPGQSDFEAKAFLKVEGSDDRRNVPVALLDKKREGSLVKMLAEIQTGELNPGEYTVSFQVKPKDSPSTAEVEIKFSAKDRF